MKNTPIKKSFYILANNISIFFFISIVSVIAMYYSFFLGYFVNIILFIGFLRLIASNQEKNNVLQYLKSLAYFASNLKLFVRYIIVNIFLYIICWIYLIFIFFIFPIIYSMFYFISKDIAFPITLILFFIFYIIIFLKYSSALAVLIYLKMDVFGALSISSKIFSKTKGNLIRILLLHIITILVIFLILFITNKHYIVFNIFSFSSNFHEVKINTLNTEYKEQFTWFIFNIVSSIIFSIMYLTTLVATLLNVKYLVEVEKDDLFNTKNSDTIIS